MPIYYKLVKRIKPGAPSQSVYAPVVETLECLSFENITKMIARESHLVDADVDSVLRAFIYQISFYVLESYTVDLGNFGRICTSVSTDQVDSPLDYTRSMVRGVNYVYRPSVYVKKMMKEAVLKKVFVPTAVNRATGV